MQSEQRPPSNAPESRGIKFYTFFSLAYLAVLLLCIFLGIESWPFSDFGVYRNQHHPEQIEIYRLGYAGADGVPIWFFGNNEKRENKSIYDSILRLSEDERKTWLSEVAQQVSAKITKRPADLIIFKQSLVERDGSFVLQTEPYIKVPLE